ncbi:hypothetical protein [Pseudomonas sp. 34 E 7]|nr:hypothetical protein [Pseudomonas sp. 34 E 7]
MPEQFAQRAQVAQVDPPHPVAIAWQHALGERQSQGTFADTGHSGQGQQPLPGHAPYQHAYQLIATDHRAQPRRQVVRCRQRRQRALHGRSEAIAALRMIEDQRLHIHGATQRGNVHAQVIVFNHAVGPDPFDQGRLADEVPRRFQQHREDIQGAPAQRHRPAGLADQTLVPMKRIGAEAHRRRMIHVRKSAETPVLECLRILFPWARRYLASWRSQDNAGTGSDTDNRVPQTDRVSLTELLSVLGRVQAELFTEQKAHMPHAAEA